ncbi:MAG: hypothetical protein LBR61_05695, partial [Synergistaceae bacterium]|nr:hypothetical protein [Synergistaceae bacterium]
ANDPESTGLLFEETGWQPEETILLYHHRPDREARLKNFRTWIEERPWKETVFTRQRRPLFPSGAVLWNDRITDPPSFAAWRRGRGRIFACGNVAGWPLKFLLEQKERNEQKRTGE